MKNLTANIIKNEPISKDFYQLTFTHPTLETPKVGQFLTLKVSQAQSHPLRRPFAFSNWNEAKKEAQIIYQIRGEVTQILSTLKKGDKIEVLSPLGNGYPIPYSTVPKTPIPNSIQCNGVILVAGGVGLGPILWCAKEFTKLGIPVTLLSGFRSKEFVPKSKYLPKDVILCTDDGSAGFHGNVVQYLESKPLSEWEGKAVMSCGPLPMMKALTKWCNNKGLQSFVSMEEMMGCGVGACMGCIVYTHEEKGYSRACMEGPVFDSEIINWEKY